ncbi:MAG: LemA family protein [bacterium]
MMFPVTVIILVMILAGGVMWVGQAYRILTFARIQRDEAWLELKTALQECRDMIPYIVAAVPAHISPALDVLGNACDMAANVEGVRECSQAESRLKAAVSRLFEQLDTDATLETLDMIMPLRERLKDQGMRVELLKDAYNRMASVYNSLLKKGAARILVSVGMARPVELF